jgi:hypothetical protein
MGENSVRCCYSCQHTSTRTIRTRTHTGYVSAMRVPPYQRKNRLVVPSPQLPALRPGRASGVPVHCARKMIVVPYTLESASLTRLNRRCHFKRCAPQHVVRLRGAANIRSGDAGVGGRWCLWWSTSASPSGAPDLAAADASRRQISFIEVSIEAGLAENAGISPEIIQHDSLRTPCGSRSEAAGQRTLLGTFFHTPCPGGGASDKAGYGRRHTVADTIAAAIFPLCARSGVRGAGRKDCYAHAAPRSALRPLHGTPAADRCAEPIQRPPNPPNH